jgi:hypothetical protein
MSECVNKWMSEWVIEWVREWVSAWLYEWVSDWVNELASECVIYLVKTLFPLLQQDFSCYSTTCWVSLEATWEPESQYRHGCSYEAFKRYLRLGRYCSPEFSESIHQAEICVILGYYTAYSGNFLQTFRDKLSVPSVRFKGSKFRDRLRWDRQVFPKRRWEITTIHYVISHNSADLI